MEKENENVIFIGKKPFINYISSILMQINEMKNKQVIIRARGKFISKAVDVVEITLNNYLKGIDIQKQINTSTVSFLNDDNKTIFVSSIKIDLNNMS